MFSALQCSQKESNDGLTVQLLSKLIAIQSSGQSHQLARHVLRVQIFQM